MRVNDRRTTNPFPERWLLPLALAIFFLSGAAALIYQVAWQRMLVIFAGTDVHSATIVVAAFMVGLGCGSVTGGQIADRVSGRRGMALFAAAELAVGLFGAISPTLFYGILYERLGDLALGVGGTAAVLVFALFWPTFLMGISLPLLARGLTAGLGRAASTVGWLYGINTLGAGIGAIAATFLLLPELGMAGSVWMAAALNVTCGVGAAGLVLKGGADARRPVQTAPPTATAVAPAAARPIGTWLAIFALSGFIALSLEIVWFRVLGVMLKSTAFTFGTLLALYLSGIGLGAMAGSAVAARIRRPQLWFFLLQAGAGAYAALSLTAVINGIGHWHWLAWFTSYFAGPSALDVGAVVGQIQHTFGFGEADPKGSAGVVWDFARLYVLLPAALFGPPTFMAGFSFPLLQRAVQTDLSQVGRRVGALVAANILGSTLGAFITGWVLLDLFGSPGTLKLLFVLSAGFGALAVQEISGLNGRALRLAAYSFGGVATAAVVVGMPSPKLFWASLHGTVPASVIVAEDGSGLSLLRAEVSDFRRVVVYIDGLGQSWIPYGNIHTILGALPAFVHPNPQRAMVIGLGSGDTLFAMAGRSELQHLTSIEIIKPQATTLTEFGRFRGYPGVVGILSDPRIERVSGDGRLYIRRAGLTYDIIEADALRPGTAYSGNLYSDAYFRLLRDHLNPGGLAVTWAPTPRVIRTFDTVFPYVWRHDQVMMGSNRPIEVDGPAILERLRRPEVSNYYFRSEVDIETLLRPYLTGTSSIEQTRLDQDTSDINTDLRPRDEFDLPPWFDTSGSSSRGVAK